MKHSIQTPRSRAVRLSPRWQWRLAASGWAALLLARFASAASSPDLSVTNEAASLRITVALDGGAWSYQVDRLAGAATTPLVERSPLGLTRTDADFTTGLTLVSTGAPKVVEEDYVLATGKQLKVHARGVERTFRFQNTKGVAVDLAVRAYRDGVAFRYGLPGHGSQLLQISGESTGFKLPASGRVWVQPYSKVDVWAPGYEADYCNGVPVGAPAPGPEGWALPLLAHVNGHWILVTESGLEPSYFAVHLEPKAEDGLYRVRLPEAPETYGVAPQAAAVTLPWVSPWRVIVVSDRAGGINESTLVTDLARPSELADTSWIKPGMASWSWWGDMPSPRDYARLVPFVDVAAKFHWRYSLLDLGWDEMNGGGVKALAEYAAKQGVGLTVWYNSAGRHNQVPDAGPKDVVNDPLRREAEFARLEALGIKGVKVDFMQSDKQFVIALYHDILRDAAKHHLLVDFHGCTIPRGWQRTYPNLVTMEAVRGAEQYWDKTFAENAQTFNSIYVFTRNAIGPMDYTPMVLITPTQDGAQRVPHLTTYAHELALLVVFESGITHVVDPASDLLALPALVQDYLTDLPTVWDESHVVAGAPGELAVLARRAGTTWYVSGINGLKSPRTVSVPLSFLGDGAFDALVIADGAKPDEFAPARSTVTGKDALRLDLAARGGFAARLRAPSR